YRASFSIVNDLVHTKLDVKFDWQHQHALGKAWITLKPHFYNTDSLTLDAKSFDVNQVALVTPKGNVPLKYTYDSLQLKISLDKTYKKDESYTVFIDYTAKPNEVKQEGSSAINEAKGLYFINADGKNPDEPREVWTQGETESNSCWFPTIDKPNMKMTWELSVTAEDSFVTLSNGLMTSTHENGDGTHTDVWKLDQPFAPYLATMVAGPFAVVKDHWKNMEVNYYVDQNYKQYAKNIFGHTPEMIQHFSDILGVPYVWPKYSQVAVHDFVSGAMENVTATTHGAYVQQTAREMIDGNEEDVISHELFHQWFGDLVTTESWANITLNESFADYGEYLWNEYKYGKDEADYRFYRSLHSYLQSPENASIPLVRYYYNDREDVFDPSAIAYNKGGRILHMLRNYVGDDAFFASLHEYLISHEYQSAEVADLRMAFEKVTGEDLNWFFNQWYFAPGHPELNISYKYYPEEKKVYVTVEQIQQTSDGTPIYQLPVNVDVYAGGKVNRYKATFQEKKQTISFPCDAKPDLVNFDADKMLLCRKTDTKSDTAFAFQFHHAPKFMDRLEAIQFFSKNSQSPFAAKIFEEGLNDPFWYIRQACINNIKTNDLAGNEELKYTVRALASSDPKSSVRAAALKQLSYFNDPDDQALMESALKDSSYDVITQVLVSIMKRDTAQAIQLAQPFEKEKSDDINIVLSQIYSQSADSSKIDFYIEAINHGSRIAKYKMLDD
ncbi:MAG: M1 family aminopeptidase, partial [Chitinophagales bacterium]